MNKIFAAFCILIALSLSGSRLCAQHKSTLWGLSEMGGPQNTGYIFQYDISSNTLSKEIWLNKTNSEPVYFPEVFKTDSNYLYAVKGQNDSLDKAMIVRFDRKS